MRPHLMRSVKLLITTVTNYLRSPASNTAPTPVRLYRRLKLQKNNTDVAQRLRGAYAENQQKPENTGIPGTDDEQLPYNLFIKVLLGAGVLGLGVSTLGVTGSEGTSEILMILRQILRRHRMGLMVVRTDTDVSNELHTTTLTADGVSRR